MKTKPAKAVPTRLLVIGYGNELRSDDGIGPKIAAAVAEWNAPEIRGLACHQLTPELAVPIAAAGAVVFVDATAEPLARVRLAPVAPSDVGNVMTHAADARSLLNLARSAFGQYPHAWTLTIPAENFAFSRDLSPIARKGFQTALKAIRSLADSLV